MQGYINSSVVGGRSGYIFNDIFAMGSKGEHSFVVIHHPNPNRPHQATTSSTTTVWPPSIGECMVSSATDFALSPDKRQLNRDHPIKLITVSSGWIVRFTSSPLPD